MSPETHLLASWVIGAKMTDNTRDCRLVALAGVLPDLDGLGLIADAFTRAMGWKKTLFYEHYHHYLLHGALGGLVIAGVLMLFAQRKWRVALLCLAVFHLHLLCDFVGSRGPSPEDLWPIFYLGPFDKDPMWIWKGQWRLDGWQNRIISVALFAWALWLAVQKGYSFVGVFSRRLDRTFVRVLRKWHADLVSRLASGGAALNPLLYEESGSRRRDSASRARNRDVRDPHAPADGSVGRCSDPD
jgi:inner membrane protein